MIKILKSLPKSSFLHNMTKYNYMSHEIQMRNERSGYYMDPNDVGRRLVKLISLHDKV